MSLTEIVALTRLNIASVATTIVRDASNLMVKGPLPAYNPRYHNVLMY